MVSLDKKDSMIEVYMGTTWDFKAVKTVKSFREALEEMAHDLPDDSDGTLQIAEIHGEGTKITYTLNQGLPQ
ncbi:hypothetical protein J4225_03045 [Candidatus Pacearchaeota archaeon]|nr:hypothetical protein [uncultured archaeon]MBS3085637.1 hypothetical protein [Candidatus Pacearchaeota archaeon]